MLSKKIKSGAIICAVAMAVPLGAAASTVTLDNQGSDPFGTQNLKEVVKIESGTTRNVYAGAFQVTDSTGSLGDFTAWCIDLNETYNMPGAFAMSDSSGNTGVDNKLQGLFENHYTDALTSTAKAAAFQASIWELITDTSGANLGAGNFILKTPGTIYNTAAGYLNNLSFNGPAQYALSFFTASGEQDLVAAFDAQDENAPAPVPLPGAAWLLAIGLAGLAGLRKTRAS